MINTVVIENTAGTILRPYEDLGLLLASYDAPSPNVKSYRVEVEGADGAVDMTEWAGEPRFSTRPVTMKFRDPNQDGYEELLQFVHGRIMKLTFSDDPEWYYIGRCETAPSSIRKHVVDLTLDFICDPYKLAHLQTVVKRTATSEGVTATLKAVRKSCIPEITLESACTLEYAGNTYSLSAGVHRPPTFLIRDIPQEVTITGSDDVTIKWQDGAL